MRQLDAGTLALYQLENYDDHYRLKIANGSGSMIDMRGRWVTFNLDFPNPDSPIGGLNVGLIREFKTDGTDSLSPIMVKSTMNRLNDGVTYSPLLEIARAVTLEVALTPIGGARPADGSALWYHIFDGNIDKISWPHYTRPAQASLRCTDRCGLLNDIKSETAYTYAAGTAIETAIQQVLNNNGCGWMPFYVPVATGKVLQTNYAPGLQKSVWEQVWALAQSMGWVIWLRYKADGTPALTLFRPPREKTVSDLTITSVDNYSDIDISKDQLRNVGYAQYSDANGARRNVGPVVDGSSISRYGNIRRPFWINFDPGSPVRSYNDALAVLNDAVPDVAVPDATATVQMRAMPFVECSVDLYTFKHDDVFFDQDQQLAPYTGSMSKDGDQRTVTNLNTRGQASSGYRTWRQMISEVGLEIISATPMLDSNNLLRFTVQLPATVVRWRVWSKLGSTPLQSGGDPDPVYLKGPSVEGTEVNQIAWAVQNGTHYIVVRAYAADGSFHQFETTYNVTGVGSGPGTTVTTGGGGGATGVGAPDTIPGTPFMMPSGNVSGSTKEMDAAWINSGTASQWYTEVEWTVNGVAQSPTDSLNPTAEAISEVFKYFAIGVTVSVRARYVNRSVTPNVAGNWSLSSNQITVT